MTDMVGSRTLRSQWDETVRCYGSCSFLEYVSVEDQVTSYTYAEMDRKVKQAANFFLELGIGRQELVALHLHNTPDYLVCWLALAQIGAVSVPLNEHYRREESLYVLNKCGIRRVITEPGILPLYTVPSVQSQLSELICIQDGGGLPPGVLSLEEGMARQDCVLGQTRPLRSEDMAVILFTSGTTRHPKGAVYTHCNVIYGGLVHVAQMGMEHRDRFLTSMPCYHMDFQEMAAMPVICTGSTLIMVEHYSARRFWSQVCRYQAHFTDTMSIMNRTMMMQPVQPWEKDHCLKQIYFSMGMSDEEKQRFEDRFRVSLLNSYGMTETVSGVTCAPLTGEKNWPSVGRVALSYEIKISGPDGRELPAGQVGEICVHGVPGRSLVAGYYRDDEATAQLIDPEGWLHSGDQGYLDEDGWLFFVDRSANMIKRAGENVSSLEVECVLTSHPDVVDAAVVGVPDPIRDQAVKAFVQLREDSAVTPAQITAYCAQRLAKFKVPTEVKFVGGFPRTATGKIQKSLLC